MTKPIQWTGFLLVDGQMIKQFTPQYSVKSGYWFGPGKYATATNEFDGAAEGVWQAKGVGNHTIRCEIAQSGNALEAMTNATNNQKEIIVPVAAHEDGRAGHVANEAQDEWPADPGQPAGDPGRPPLPPGSGRKSGRVLPGLGHED